MLATRFNDNFACNVPNLMFLVPIERRKFGNSNGTIRVTKDLIYTSVRAKGMHIYQQ